MFGRGGWYETQPIDLAVDDRGTLYYLTLGDGNPSGGEVRRISVPNQSPELQLSGNITYRENGPPRVIAPTAVVSDADATNFDRGRLEVAITAGGEASDRLAIRTTTSVALQGNKVVVNGHAIGVVSGIGTGQLAVELNANATRVLVTALLRNITYQNVSENPAAGLRTVSAILSDGRGDISQPATAGVQVVPVNDAPRLGGIGGGIAYAENAASIQIASGAAVADPDSANFSGGRLIVEIRQAQAAAIAC